MAIEQAADNALANSPAPEFKKMKGVPRNALMKPSDAEHRLGDQRFALGDRVVYVEDRGRVPIATRGTVVGISRTPRTTLLDVVFDVTFMSGTTLGERCSPFRGSTVPVASVLNLTNKQVIAGSKTSVEKRPAPSSTPITTRGAYGSPAGPNGRGQYREAGAPPPLRGSFRGAVAGQNGFRGSSSARGRGRGSGLGYGNDNAINATPAVYNNLAMRDGPPNGARGGLQANGVRGGRGGAAPAPQVGFNAVPPPASLDARGRGGRGRARGTPRGRGAPRGRGGVAQVQPS
jgi:hypothetical protein